jgi:hypothetical protein
MIVCDKILGLLVVCHPRPIVRSIDRSVGSLRQLPANDGKLKHAVYGDDLKLCEKGLRT